MPTVTYAIQTPEAARRARAIRYAQRGGIVAALIGLALAPTPIEKLSPWGADEHAVVTIDHRIDNTADMIARDVDPDRSACPKGVSP